MKNIVLIGMPASGKSTIGVLLAKTLGLGFCDTDLLIQQQEGCLLQEFIDHHGIERFLDAECSAVLSLNCRDSVIATGGSVVFRDAAMQKLRRDGIVVFLDAPLSEVISRLNNIQTRGVAAQRGMSIAEIYEERLPLYRAYADITISTEHRTAEQTVELIANAIADF